MILLEDQSPPDPDMPVREPRGVRCGQCLVHFLFLFCVERRVDYRRGFGTCLPDVSLCPPLYRVRCRLGRAAAGIWGSRSTLSLIFSLSPLFFIPCSLRRPRISFKQGFFHRLASGDKLDSRIPSNLGRCIRKIVSGNLWLNAS